MVRLQVAQEINVTVAGLLLTHQHSSAKQRYCAPLSLLERSLTSCKVSTRPSAFLPPDTTVMAQLQLCMLPYDDFFLLMATTLE